MSDAYDELTLELPREAAEEASARLLELGSLGLQEIDPDAGPPRQLWDEGPEPAPGPRVRLVAWFAEGERPRIEAGLIGLPLLDQGWKTEDTDWEAASRDAFPPLEVGGFVIAPPWNAPEGALVITPANGFGSGAHPTTQTVLRVLGRLLDETSFEDVLDVGCGTGILALAAASRGHSVRGIDVSEVAVAEARANAEQNSLEASFSTTPLEAAAPADLVLANLHAELLVPLAADLKRVSRRYLVLSGIRAIKREAVEAAFAPWIPHQRHEQEGWVSLEFRAVTGS